MRLNQAQNIFMVGIFTLFLSAGCSYAGVAHQRAGVDCGSLSSVDLSQDAEAVAHIDEAKIVERNESGGSVCEIAGHITATIQILLRLPIGNWNGKFVELGCGGYCGSTEHIKNCDGPLSRGYACAVNDGGHRSRMDDAAWAYNNLSSLIDFMVSASHLTSIVGKKIVNFYYGSAPKHSYFIGCSAGGEQAMMEVQRFPWDFDGVIAGQPTGELEEDLNGVWAIRAFNDELGRPLFNSADLTLLHDKVLESCDMNDGVRDGLIGDPRACRFNPTTLTCGPKGREKCLTKDQVSAVLKLYNGPQTSMGQQLSVPAAMRGSEKSWLLSYAGDPRSTTSFFGEPFRYWFFQPNPGPMWSLSQFDFDEDYKRSAFVESLISTTSPDIRRFASNGAKLIAYAGWTDPVGMPAGSIDWYETTARVFGGDAETQKFFRLFMVPGMNHCTGGDGPYQIDYLTYLEDWVEHGKAPDKVIGYHPASTVHGTRGADQKPEKPFSRPIYPYPLTAHYRGRGDQSDAVNFLPWIDGRGEAK